MTINYKIIMYITSKEYTSSLDEFYSINCIGQYIKATLKSKI